MLNNRTANIIIIAAIAVLLGIRLSGLYPSLSLWWLAAPPLLLLPFYIRGAMNIRSGFFIKTVCAASTSENVVALSFDDGPEATHTPLILDILDKHQVKAAFFCIGKNIEGNAHLLQRIHAEGHMIGNHTYSHDFWFDMHTSSSMGKDMEKMDTVTINATGLQPRLFRPPYGVTNPNLARAIKKNNYVPVGWSIRSMDTVATDENKLLQKIMSELHPGAVILLHDTCSITASILPRLISAIKAEGYRLERMDKMLKVPAYV
ncbi:polysaccharide deacetylase family protein [Chitinophaga oryzae]|uniref:Polysaccharide deacetylase family protein n=1 Tax=Chitinophaga oryzae TaxID=2725414 RepID=A0ABX6LIM0_9BACT|nr:polysaccharide deacetylase family protein [Chitinophaga oryzae]QJB39913.1 polysaccharide deacetylase family protein [Chitinophaga oryzae]